MEGISVLLSVTPGHSAGYLTNQVGAGMESYYTGAVGAGEPPGSWWGKGADLLGLEGEVDAEVMSALYERYLDPTDPRFADPDTRHDARTLGRRPKEYRTPDQIVEDRIREYTTEYASTPEPEQVQAWRLEAEKRLSGAAHFYDLTFSPDKSVTVLWTAFTRAAAEAGAAGDEQAAAGWQWAADQVEEAVVDAAGRALDYVERTAAFTRTGRHGARAVTGRWADVAGLTAARFLQHTSREGDPQLHVHQAVINKAQTATGDWLALDGEAIYAARPAAGAVAERALELDLTRRLGIEWEMRADGVGRRVVGVDHQLEELFSSRSRAIGPEAERRLDLFEAMYGRPANNIERARIIKKVTLATRPGKTDVSESPEELNERWHAEAAGQVAGGLGVQAHRFRAVLQRAAQAADSTTESVAVAGSGVVDVQELLDALDGDLDEAGHARASNGAGADGAAQNAPGVAGRTVFSVRAVLAEALEACHGPDGKSTFTRHDLIRQLNLALPDDLGRLGPQQAGELLEALADLAMADPDVVQVSGLEVGRVPEQARLADGTADTVSPARVAYATRGHLAAEWAVLRAAGERGRSALPAHVVEDWLDAHPAGQALSPAQRQALLGLATSDAAASVLVGPAGTGKSFTAAAFDAAWRDLTAQLAEHRAPHVQARYGPGRAVGVAITQAAADVLAEDGVTDSANIAAFLAAQRRLTAGRPAPGDERWQLGAHDVLLVDEASMADTAALTGLLRAVDDAGARLVLMGDPHQLGPVGAGGMMRAAIDRDAQTYTLTEVRRFTADWEATASLRLRDGHPDAVSSYDARGRLVDAGRERDAVAAIARAAAADHLAGKDTVVITASNEHAAQVAAQVRRHLADAGVVGPAAVQLDRDGTTAGVGDLVQARRIDRDLGLVNREVYRVDAVSDDGTLHATSTRTGITHTIPADYTATDLSLAYASTAHGAQGRTVDVGHLLLTPTSDRAGAYVGLTRGRESNTAWAVTDTGVPNPDAPGGTTVHTARGLLARALTVEGTDAGERLEVDLRARADAAAVDIADAADRTRRNAGTLLGLIEDETRIAARAQLETHLDRLTTDGALTDTERARLGTEQGTEHLARLLRAHEHAGHDPYTVLHAAIAAGTLDKARALSQVIAARIDKTRPLPPPTTSHSETVGEASTLDELSDVQDAREQVDQSDSQQQGVDDGRAEYVRQLRSLYTDREHTLGQELAEQAATDPTSLPVWVHKTLGPLPDTDTDTDTGTTTTTAGAATVAAAGWSRAEWIARAGVVAAQREAAGWSHPQIPLGRCPGVSTPEKRAAWHTAYTAAGMPTERRPEAELSDGRLLVRARAAERVRDAAPPSAYDAQRAHHQAAETAAREAVLARAAGHDDDATAHDTRAEQHRTAATRLDDIADARATWLLHHHETLTAGDTATAELLRRGRGPGLEPDRTTATNWLDWHHLEQEARRADDAHRTITEHDLYDPETHDRSVADGQDVTADDAADEASRPAVLDDPNQPAPWPTHGLTPAELEHITHAAELAGVELVLDNPTDLARPDAPADDTQVDDAQGADDQAHDTRFDEVGLDRPRPEVDEVLDTIHRAAGSPATGATRTRRAQLTADAALAEINAAAAAAAQALDTVADQASHDTTEPAPDNTADAADEADWEARRAQQIEAEHDAVAAGAWHDDPALDPVAEHDIGYEPASADAAM